MNGAHLLVRSRKLAAEFRVAAPLLRQTMQIFEPWFHDQLAGFGGTGQVPDRIVELEKIVIGKPANVGRATQ